MGQIFSFILVIFLSWGRKGNLHTNFRVSKIKVLLEKVTFLAPHPPQERNIMKNKYCPLLSAAEGDSLVTCQGELCAWYVPPVRHGDGGRCAVQALPDLAAGVRRL